MAISPNLRLFPFQVWRDTTQHIVGKHKIASITETVISKDQPTRIQCLKNGIFEGLEIQVKQQQSNY